MSNFRDFLKEQLQNPEFRKEYEALEEEYSIKQAMIDAQKMSQDELSQRTRLTQSDISKPEHGKPNKHEAFQHPLNLLPKEGVDLDPTEADRSELKECSPR